MAWWQRQAGKNTKSKIVSILRRGPRTVEELAESLRLTDNAVRAQLAALEREKIVQSAGVRHDGTVGKPATMYALAHENSALFSSAYAPVLTALLEELGQSMPARQIESLLKRTGTRLAESIPAKSSFDERVKASAALLTSLGADADLVQTKEGYEIRGHGCVLADAVVACPAACSVLEQVLRDVSGGEVKEHCDRSHQPNCHFSVAPAR